MTTATLNRTADSSHAEAAAPRPLDAVYTRLNNAVRAFEKRMRFEPGRYITSHATGMTTVHLHLRVQTGRGKVFAGAAVPGLDSARIVLNETCPVCHRAPKLPAGFTVEYTEVQP